MTPDQERALLGPVKVILDSPLEGTEQRCPCGAWHRLDDVAVNCGGSWLCFTCCERLVPDVHDAVWHFTREVEFLMEDRWAPRETIYNDAFRLLYADPSETADLEAVMERLHAAASQVCHRRYEWHTAHPTPLTDALEATLVAETVAFLQGEP